MSPLVPWYVLAATLVTMPSGEEILARVSETNARRRAVAYSGIREYSLRNARFAMEATVRASMIHRPGEGMHFTVLKSSGSVKLAGIVERLLAFEADASVAPKRCDYEISPVNYQARFRRTETIAGRLCYVIDLMPRRKSRYLLDGTLWVDSGSYGVVRLQGSPSASVSMWVGTPHITEEFSEIGGLWLPSHTHSVGTGRLLGASELEIRYTDYEIKDLGTPQARLGSAVYE